MLNWYSGDPPSAVTQPQTSSVALFTPYDSLTAFKKHEKLFCAPQECYMLRHNNLQSFQVAKVTQTHG